MKREERRSGKDRRRYQPNGITTALIAVAVLLVGTLFLIFSYQQEVRRLEGVIHNECVARQSYDNSSQTVRQVSRDYWLQYIRDEGTNRFIDNALRAHRVAGAQRMVDALSDTLGKSVRGGCAGYR